MHILPALKLCHWLCLSQGSLRAQSLLTSHWFPAMGCFKYCIRCLRKVLDTSLVATILCFSRVALFCGSAHVAFVVTMVILDPGFSTNTSDHALLSEVIQPMQYVIYGIMSFFFLYGIILSSTWEVKELYRVFETIGRWPMHPWNVCLPHLCAGSGLACLCFVFIFYSMWSTCEVIESPRPTGQQLWNRSVWIFDNAVYHSLECFPRKNTWLFPRTSVIQMSSTCPTTFSLWPVWELVPPSSPWSTTS